MTDIDKMIVVYETSDETEARRHAGILMEEGIFVYADRQGVWKFGEFIPSIKLLVKPSDRNRAVIALRSVASQSHDEIIDEPRFSIEKWNEWQKKRNDPT